MTKQELLNMAREAGLIIDGNNSGDDDLFAFAAVVSARAAALEREACAKVCDEARAARLAEQIRARGQS